MSVREGLEFESQIRSDCAALNGMIAAVLDAAGSSVHAMRDPTRGGLASTLNEIACASGVGMAIDERALPVRAEVQSACELLGLDPVYVANEGKAVFFVAPMPPSACWTCCGLTLWGGKRPHRTGGRGASPHAGGAHADGRQSRDPPADRRAIAAHLLSGEADVAGRNFKASRSRSSQIDEWMRSASATSPLPAPTGRDRC